MRGLIRELYRGDFDLHTLNPRKPWIGFGPGEESCSSTPQEEEDAAADMRALCVSKRRREGCGAGQRVCVPGRAGPRRGGGEMRVWALGPGQRETRAGLLV